MVRLIYIVSQKHFIQPDKMICSLSNYGNSGKLIKKNKYSEYDYVFEDWTSNFNNLLYWNTDLDLNNRTLTEVLHKLSVAISRLKRENIEPKQYEDFYTYPSWWFGHKNGSGLSQNLSNEERKPILLLHLIDLYDAFMKINKKNKTYYCYYEIV